jgi:hypothetical protein
MDTSMTGELYDQPPIDVQTSNRARTSRAVAGDGLPELRWCRGEGVML